MSEWSLLLDRMERQVRRQERALDAGEPLPGILQLDAPATPMTPGERVRATALMQRTDGLITSTLESMKAQRRPNSTPYG
jgi:hypothetical protein